MEKLRYALYTGCTARESTPELLKSTLAVAEKLGIELILLDEATCCGASHLQDYDDMLSLVLNARNICYAEKLGLTMVTICNTCQLNTAMTKHRLDTNPALKAKVNEKLAEVGLEYKGTSEVTHFLYAIIQDYGLDNLSQKVNVPLSQFNIAPFYGCHNIRPSELQNISNGGENPYNPTSLDDLIIACGGNNVDYDAKNKCCGFHAELQSPHTAAVLTGNALSGAIDANADWMVTPCPLCHLKLDVQHHSASKAIGREVKLPVLHMPQMVGLALGCTPAELGLQHHVTRVNFV
ncbi:MAG TPA: CoB--CoM heterodisulfide reductase iron-sulfur subunit B family protein [Sulfuricurvum sp.]|nr:MAG: heterodisulfide reductase subunit B [Campylobacterales bacterium 16-40-21]OZA04098.1 MAG: heterodisulfide reductase subunit B [Sulfuricurvum sp. 17-40-25]HQS66102.1 CoB--CoM heterodisulfide reductase iron-sulfur subunit B family protein [Sulfuricurvum sp.]HQT36540.1 CoB--CoM heterodisulfide reductase iron-sulfur subunit B family protein [Sulfuricurvum sp.]